MNLYKSIKTAMLSGILALSGCTSAGKTENPEVKYDAHREVQDNKYKELSGVICGPDFEIRQYDNDINIICKLQTPSGHGYTIKTTNEKFLSMKAIASRIAGKGKIELEKTTNGYSLKMNGTFSMVTDTPYLRMACFLVDSDNDREITDTEVDSALEKILKIGIGIIEQDKNKKE